MVWVVATVAEDEAEVVASFGQGRRDAEVVGKPVPFGLVPVQVTMPYLQEDAQRFARLAGDQSGVGVAVRHLREAGQAADDAAEQVGAKPGGGEGAVATAASSADAPPAGSSVME